MKFKMGDGGIILPIVTKGKHEFLAFWVLN